VCRKPKHGKRCKNCQRCEIHDDVGEFKHHFRKRFGEPDHRSAVFFFHQGHGDPESSLEERDETPEARLAAEDEFLSGAMDPADPPPVDPSRRDFMSLVAASAALVCATAIGVALGGVLFKYIPEAAIKWVAGTAFIAVGLWVLAKG